MPNWCEGNIRMRGKKEDILNLLRNEIVYCVRDWETRKTILHPIVVETNEIDDIRIKSSIDDPRGWYYIKGSKRAFLDNIQPAEFLELEDTWYIIFECFKQAWALSAEDFVEVSKKYNVDIHIFGWERGMEFTQEVEILNGVITKNESKDYPDWLWDCDMPYLGG